MKTQNLKLNNKSIYVEYFKKLCDGFLLGEVIKTDSNVRTREFLPMQQIKQNPQLMNQHKLREYAQIILNSMSLFLPLRKSLSFIK